MTSTLFCLKKKKSQLVLTMSKATYSHSMSYDGLHMGITKFEPPPNYFTIYVLPAKFVLLSTFLLSVSRVVKTQPVEMQTLFSASLPPPLLLCNPPFHNSLAEIHNLGLLSRWSPMQHGKKTGTVSFPHLP